MSENFDCDCCIAGGGPAGMLLGFLLARAAIKVIVLEKHKDFFRDFRGDTIHPSTLRIMDELGLLEQFMQVPHQEVKTIYAIFNNQEVQIGDFTHLFNGKTAMALMPQWDFLNFIARQAQAYPGFQLKMEAEVTGLIKRDGRVTGVTVKTPGGELKVKARLVVGCDGRHSDVRQLAGLNVINTGAPIDVLWFRISKHPDDPTQSFGRFLNGALMVLLDRADYWQCAYVIEKGGYETIKQRGLENFRNDLSAVSPFLTNRLNELKSWEDISMLSVAIDHLEKWYTGGLLCIGDSAHAMSPIGGVGINLALQDAVAAANILYPHLKAPGDMDTTVLAQVQKRREFATRVIQRIQVRIQNGLAGLRHKEPAKIKLPLFMRLLNAFPLLRRIPARLVGLGIRPEHVKTPKVKLLF